MQPPDAAACQVQRLQVRERWQEGRRIVVCHWDIGQVQVAQLSQRRELVTQGGLNARSCTITAHPRPHALQSVVRGTAPLTSAAEHAAAPQTNAADAVLQIIRRHTKTAARLRGGAGISCCCCPHLPG